MNYQIINTFGGQITLTLHSTA